MRELVLWLLIAWFSFGAIATVAMIGKKRATWTPTVAIIQIVFCAAIIAGIWFIHG